MDSYESASDTDRICPSDSSAEKFSEVNNSNGKVLSVMLASTESGTVPSTTFYHEHHNNTMGSFEGEQVPLCSLDSSQDRYQQHPDAQPQFLREFEPRTSFLEREEPDPSVTRPIRSIDLALGRRRSRAASDEQTTPPNTTPWLVLSIFSIFCCGWFFGVFSLIFVCQAREERFKERYSISRHALFKARVVLFAAFIIGAVAWIAIGYRLYEATHKTDGGTQHPATNSTLSSLVDHM